MKTKGWDERWKEKTKWKRNAITKRHKEKMKLKRNERTKERKETNVIKHETLGRNCKHKTRK